MNNTKMTRSVAGLLNEASDLKVSRNTPVSCVGDEAERWFELVDLFRRKIVSDQKSLIKHEVSGRGILYTQLADAYKIGLELISDEYLSALRRLAQHHNMDDARKALEVVVNNNTSRRLNAENPDDIQREIKPEVSPWVYIVKLLYGKWIDTSKMTASEKKQVAKRIGVKNSTDLEKFAPDNDATDEMKSVYQEWRPNRSAEKYAVVFRYLDNHSVAPDDVVRFIENFNDENHGKRLLGIEQAGRVEARQNTETRAPSQQVIDKRNRYIARAERRSNWNVFAVEKPNTFPSDVQFARAVIKIEGDELVIVGFKEMSEKEYGNHAVGIGKPLLDEEDKKAAQRQNEIDAAKPDAKRSIDSMVHGNAVAELVADGDDADEINAAIRELLKSRAAKLASSKAIEGFVELEV